jgi:hypothetical protein
MDIREITARIRWAKKSSAVTKKRTNRRVQAMADAIQDQFPEVKNWHQIKLKHLLYIKNAWFDNEGLQPTTMADYSRAMRLMVTAMDKSQHWFGPLRLAQNRQRGGRPTKSRVTRSKSKNIRSRF